jgi:hypothetical protein
MGFDSRKIIVTGRSLGTGPAVHAGTKCKIGVLILISPFMSIKMVAKNLAGKLGELLVKERFNNVEKADKIKSPVLILHG